MTSLPVVPARRTTDRWRTLSGGGISYASTLPGISWTKCSGIMFNLDWILWGVCVVPDETLQVSKSDYLIMIKNASDSCSWASHCHGDDPALTSETSNCRIPRGSSFSWIVTSATSMPGLFTVGCPVPIDPPTSSTPVIFTRKLSASSGMSSLENTHTKKYALSLSIVEAHLECMVCWYGHIHAECGQCQVGSTTRTSLRWILRWKSIKF